MVCRLKAFGGLGIIDLHFLSITLQMRWLWLCGTGQAGCALTGGQEVSMSAMFQASVAVEVNNGRSVLL
jgi:hypothetical protein